MIDLGRKNYCLGLRVYGEQLEPRGTEYNYSLLLMLIDTNIFRQQLNFFFQMR